MMRSDRESYATEWSERFGGLSTLPLLVHVTFAAARGIGPPKTESAGDDRTSDAVMATNKSPMEKMHMTGRAGFTTCHPCPRQYKEGTQSHHASEADLTLEPTGQRRRPLPNLWITRRFFALSRVRDRVRRIDLCPSAFVRGAAKRSQEGRGELQRCGPLRKQAPDPIDRGRVRHPPKREPVQHVDEGQRFGRGETEVDVRPVVEGALDVLPGGAFRLDREGGRYEPPHQIPPEARCSEFEMDDVVLPYDRRDIDAGHGPRPVAREASEIVLSEEQGQGRAETLLVLRALESVSIPPFPRAPCIEVGGNVRAPPRPHPSRLRVEGSRQGAGREGRVDRHDVAEGAHAAIRPARALKSGLLGIADRSHADEGPEDLRFHGVKRGLTRISLERGPVVRNL